MTAQTCLSARHRTIIGFVIVAGKVQKSVKNENPNFILCAMAKLTGIGSGNVDGDRKITGKFRRNRFHCRKGNNVGGFIFAAERLVERAHPPIRGQQQAHVAFEANGSARSGDKAAKSGFGHSIELFLDLDHLRSK